MFSITQDTKAAILDTKADVVDLVRWLENYHIISVVVILFVAYIVREFGTRLLMRIVSEAIRHDSFQSNSDRKKRVKTLQSLVRAILHAAVWVFSLLLIIGEFKPELATALITGGSIIGVALGFGAKGVVSDFLAGIFIIYENQYRVGDIIELNRTGITGTVEAITIRTTIIRDVDGNVHHIPNGTITFTTNKSMDYSNINLDLTVAFETDLEKLEKIINKIGTDLATEEDFKKKILEAPHLGPISNFDPNGIVIKVLGKVAPSKQWEVSAELRKRIVREFARNNIAIPFQKIVVPPATKPKKVTKAKSAKKTS